MTCEEAAAKWGVSGNRVRWYCRRGKIPGATMLDREAKRWRWDLPDDATKPLMPVGVKKKGRLLNPVSEVTLERCMKVVDEILEGRRSVRASLWSALVEQPMSRRQGWRRGA